MEYAGDRQCVTEFGNVWRSPVEFDEVQLIPLEFVALERQKILIKNKTTTISDGDFPITQIVTLAARTLIKYQYHVDVSKHLIDHPATISYNNPCNDFLFFVWSS